MLLFDAFAKLHLRLPRSSSDIAVDELVYADDTMVVAVDASRAEVYMSCIASAWMDYGLWRKVRHCLFAATFACPEALKSWLSDRASTQ